MRGRLLTLAVMLACLLPAATHAQDDPQEDRVISVEDVPDDVVALLDDYGRAFVEHDAALMARVVDGAARSEVQALDNARDIRFSRFDVDALTQFSGNLAAPRIVGAYDGAQDVATYHVVEKTQIEGETGVFQEDGGYTFTRVSSRQGYGGWRLVSKRDLDPLGFFSPVHMWDLERVVVQRSARFVLLTHPGTAERMRSVLDISERAYDIAAEFWPGEQTERYAIVVPSTTEQLGRILHETVDLDKFVAFVGAGADRAGGWRPTGPRVFVHLSHLTAYNAEQQTEILAHEMLHAITRPVTGPLIPTWIEEGLANLGAGGAVGSLGSGSSDAFPSNDRFVTGSVQDIQANYARAQVAIGTLVDEQGKDGLADFYAELGSRRVVAGTDEYHVRDAIADSGWSYDAWVSAWRSRLD